MKRGGIIWVWVLKVIYGLLGRELVGCMALRDWNIIGLAWAVVIYDDHVIE